MALVKKIGKYIIDKKEATLSFRSDYNAGKNVIIGGRKNVVNANNDAAVSETLTEEEYPSGTVFSLDMNAATNDIAYTLPALTVGLEYTFLVSTTAGSGVTLTISAPSAVLEGVAMCDNGQEDISGTNFIIAATKAELGTQINVISDGTLWYMKAFCKCVIADVSSTN